METAHCLKIFLRFLLKLVMVNPHLDWLGGLSNEVLVFSHQSPQVSLIRGYSAIPPGPMLARQSRFLQISLWRNIHLYVG